jgi:hypothetical protein
MHLIQQRRSILILMTAKGIVGIRTHDTTTQLGLTRDQTRHLTITNIKPMAMQRKTLGTLMISIDSAEILKRSSALVETLEIMIAIDTSGGLMITMIKSIVNMKKSSIDSKKSSLMLKKKLTNVIVNATRKKTSALKMHYVELASVFLDSQFSHLFCLVRFQKTINMQRTQLHTRVAPLIPYAEIVFCINNKETP